MAGALGGAQTTSLQNGLPVQPGLGNDPLTHYLSRMSRHQLNEIMSEMKVVICSLRTIIPLHENFLVEK